MQNHQIGHLQIPSSVTCETSARYGLRYRRKARTFCRTDLGRMHVVRFGSGQLLLLLFVEGNCTVEQQSHRTISAKKGVHTFLLNEDLRR